MEYENAIESLNSHVETIINVKLSKMSQINHLEKMRINYTAKLELINLKITKLEQNITNDIQTVFKNAKSVKVNKRGRPRKDHYPKIMPEVIPDLVIEPVEVIESEFSV